MWKKLTFSTLAVITAVALGRFLISVAAAYPLPSGLATLQEAPVMLGITFGFLLVAAAGADLVRHFIRASLRAGSATSVVRRVRDSAG